MDNISDPFEEVVRDTKDQIRKLSSFQTPSNQTDEIIDDINEALIDLNSSISVMKQSNNIENTSMVSAREYEVQQLQHNFDTIKSNLQSANPTTATSTTDLETNRNEITEDNLDDFTIADPSQVLQQQMFREQSGQLDQLQYSLHNLQNQAHTMGTELNDQSELLDNLDEGVDTLTGKLARGRRQLEWVYEKNKEKWNDCCIILLIAALIILLILAVLI
ncbi:hypothetical protein TBLA_0J00710 [Henningerozyma blattae CBS 6284]|uniref:t-SNARE coiled-coil homology domain-containing protein n=1 Tax=Henningerozyma blattae (strain ATCC 34711 / CBS 6284 / DSM 70876 / NBRC 10599 / NRRL Y-10934 / UCD 77-7) TaxID=1071380 RepID=I2H9L7_HENB6|nr:hypothetical protein TBLA_0J00710 [Tetrapisispora blattae CBS 6284]CCH63069.1 hypothetical protein TBLA_0J00710 [Tetrapisispora blattae CBS 6284]